MRTDDRKLTTRAATENYGERVVDIAVVVNLHARRGSESVARTLSQALPSARVLASRSLDETRDFALDALRADSSLLLSAGGDGTAVALLNALRDAERGAERTVQSRFVASTRPQACSTEMPASRFDSAAAPRRVPALGALPLGTGNAWAHATGAHDWRHATERLREAAARGAALPLRRFDLVEVEGKLAHFAGTGWDAEMIDDFHAQKTGPGLIPARFRRGLAGYLHALGTRTVPRHLREPQPDVEIVNLGSDALGVDEQGRPCRLPGGEHGKVLYRGPVSVCGAGTSPEWGFRFRAFPFAGLVPRRFNLRFYTAKAVEATFAIPKLWKGTHPMRGMHCFLLDRCLVRFSRPVPFQIGGDRVGHRDEIEYSLAEEQVDMLSWHDLPYAA